MIHAETIRVPSDTHCPPEGRGGGCVSACSLSRSALSYSCRKITTAEEKKGLRFAEEREFLPDQHFHSKLGSCGDAWRPQTAVLRVRSGAGTLEGAGLPGEAPGAAWRAQNGEEPSARRRVPTSELTWQTSVPH